MKQEEPKFTYGDKLRRRTDGSLHTVYNVRDGAYYFTDGTFALIEDQECYQLAEAATGFFKVSSDVDRAPLNKHLYHGYEFRSDFWRAVNDLTERFGGRIGKVVDSRNDFLKLRFYDTYGGYPDEAWLPLYLIDPSPVPGYLLEADDEPDEITKEIEAAYGFD